MWKKLSSKEVFNHPRLSLLEDEVELPNGKQTTYLKYKDDGRGGATIIAIRGDGKILIQKEYAYPVDDIIYQFPGGGVPAGEDFEVGANRELMEEAGYRAKKMELLGSYWPNYRRSTAQIFVFVGSDLVEEKLEGDMEEQIESLWLDEKEIDELIRQGKMKNAYALAAWSLYKLKKD